MIIAIVKKDICCINILCRSDFQFKIMTGVYIHKKGTSDKSMYHCNLSVNKSVFHLVYKPGKP